MGSFFAGCGVSLVRRPSNPVPSAHQLCRPCTHCTAGAPALAAITEGGDVTVTAGATPAAASGSLVVAEASAGDTPSGPAQRASSVSYTAAAMNVMKQPAVIGWGLGCVRSMYAVTQTADMRGLPARHTEDAQSRLCANPSMQRER